MIEGRDRNQIRTAILNDFTARYGVLGLAVDIAPGSYHFNKATALSARILGLEGSAEALGSEIDLRTASQEIVERWAALLGTERGDGTKGRYTVTFTGSSSLTSVELTGRYFLRAGKKFLPLEGAVAMLSGVGICTVEAEDVGTAYALAENDTLRWGSAPTACDPTATVLAEIIPASDQESAEDVRKQVLAELRARPASGNPQHIVNIAEEHEDCHTAVVYPIVGPHPSGQAAANTYLDARLDMPGACTVLIMGPPQGANGLGAAMTHSRARTSAQAQRVREYLLGERNADGTVRRPKGCPKFFAGCDPVDWTVAWPNVSELDVTLDVTPEMDPDWSGSYALTASEEFSVTVNGDHTDLEGFDGLLYVGIGRARGGWVKRKLLRAEFGGVTTRFTLDERLPPLLGGSWATGDLVPPVHGWTGIRDAVFDLFDRLYPGDIPTLAAVPLRMSSITRRWRYPATSWNAPSNLHLNALRSAVVRCSGVLDVAVAAPLTDQTADPFELFALGELQIRPV